MSKHTKNNYRNLQSVPLSRITASGLSITNVSDKDYITEGLQDLQKEKNKSGPTLPWNQLPIPLRFIDRGPWQVFGHIRIGIRGTHENFPYRCKLCW
jgi:hypothetical protein